MGNFPYNAKDLYETMITNFSILRPCSGLLNNYVKNFWVLKGIASCKEPYVHAVVPDGTAQIICCYKGSFKSKKISEKYICNQVIYAGPVNKSTQYIINEDFEIFGICVYPYTVPLFSSITPSKFIDECVDLNEIEIFRNINFSQRLLHSKDNNSRVILTSNIFEGLMESTQIEMFLKLYSIKDIIENRSGIFNVRDLSENYNLSARHLQRRLKRYTGFSPKQLIKISRLQSAIGQIDYDSLSDLAYKTGFYDQSHFINEFRLLTGKKPWNFFVKKDMDILWRTMGKEVAFFQF